MRSIDLRRSSQQPLQVGAGIPAQLYPTTKSELERQTALIADHGYAAGTRRV